MAHQQGSKPHLGGTWLGGDPNSWAPQVWERIIKDHKTSSVLDVGCGDGYSAEWFKNAGLFSIGIEGDESSLKRASDRASIVLQHDYTEGPFPKNSPQQTLHERAEMLLTGAALDEIFGPPLFPEDPQESPLNALVWCCEFVEHVEEKYIDNFMKTFRHGRYIALTHAYPGQPGHHHVNCQYPEYWIPKIEALGFTLNRPYSLLLRKLTPALHVKRSLLFFERK